MMPRNCALSSAIRMVSLPRGGVVSSSAVTVRLSPPSARGRNSRKQVPSPGVLSTRTCPSDWRTKPNTIASPSPVPAPGALVVKNGSNTCGSTSVGMPLPVSVTSITT